MGDGDAHSSREEQRRLLQNPGTWFEREVVLSNYNSIYFAFLLLPPLKARKEALHLMEGKTIMYTAMGADWRQFGHPHKRRPLDSVILDQGVREDILLDVQEFIKNAQWELY